MANSVQRHRDLAVDGRHATLRVRMAEGELSCQRLVPPATRDCFRIERRKVRLDNLGQLFEITDFTRNFNDLTFRRKLG